MPRRVLKRKIFSSDCPRSPVTAVGHFSTSAIESHIGTFLEEVARIVSGGSKPRNGVDLQIEDEHGVTHLYAIQSVPNTKSAGARRADIESLKRAARPLRGHRLPGEMYIAVLSGRDKSAAIRAEPDITMVGSDEFWARISGISDFRARILRASTILSWLIRRRSEDEINRIKQEARELFADGDGRLDLEALANPPRVGRRVHSGPLGALDGAEHLLCGLQRAVCHSFRMSALLSLLHPKAKLFAESEGRLLAATEE